MKRLVCGIVVTRDFFDRWLNAECDLFPVSGGDKIAVRTKADRGVVYEMKIGTSKVATKARGAVI